MAKNGNDFVVTFGLAVVGKCYRLERKDALTDALWGSITGVADFSPTSVGSRTNCRPRRGHRFEALLSHPRAPLANYQIERAGRY